MASYARDPYWTRARFVSKCHRCGKAISKGQDIYYYPNGRRVLCDADDCGQVASREFATMAADEGFYN